MNLKLFNNSLVDYGNNFFGQKVQKYMFPNKYGASVAFVENGKIEVSVITLGKDNELVQINTTSITEDKVICSSEKEVVKVLNKIKELKRRVLPVELQYY